MENFVQMRRSKCIIRFGHRFSSWTHGLHNHHDVLVQNYTAMSHGLVGRASARFLALSEFESWNAQVLESLAVDKSIAHARRIVFFEYREILKPTNKCCGKWWVKMWRFRTSFWLEPAERISGNGYAVQVRVISLMKYSDCERLTCIAAGNPCECSPPCLRRWSSDRKGCWWTTHAAHKNAFQNPGRFPYSWSFVSPICRCAYFVMLTSLQIAPLISRWAQGQDSTSPSGCRTLVPRSS